MVDSDTSYPTMTIVKWELIDGEEHVMCPENKTYIKEIACEICQYGFLGNYTLRQTTCGYENYNSSPTSVIDNSEVKL